MSLIQWALPSVHLCLDIARAKVLHKHSLQSDTAVLQTSRHYHHQHNSYGNGNDEGIGESAEIIAYIEHKTARDNHPHDDGEDEWQMIQSALRPQSLKLLAMVFLHHHGAQKWRYAQYGERATDEIGSPMPSHKQMTDEGQEEGEHKCHHRHREDSIYNRIDSHLSQQTLPVILGSLARGMTEGDMIERGYP